MLIKPPTMKEINALPKTWRGMSFFAGCGGSSTGHKMSGIDILISNEFIDIARETYALNHPTTKVLGQDIRRLDPKKILNYLGLNKGELDLLDGSPPCFLADTLIQTQHGACAIQDIVKGIHVMTHAGRYRPVVQPMQRPYTGNIHTILTPSGVNYATPEHPFYVRRMEQGSLQQPVWVDARDVMPGDYVAVPTSHHEKELDTSIAALRMWGTSNKFWWLVGNLVANRQQEIETVPNSVSFISTTASRINQLIDASLDALSLTSVSWARDLTQNRFLHRSIVSPELTEFMNLFNTDSPTARKLPEFMFSLPKEMQREFIYGYQSVCSETSYDKTFLVETFTPRFASELKTIIGTAFGLPVFTETSIESGNHYSPTFSADHPKACNISHSYSLCLDGSGRGYIADKDHAWVQVTANTFEAKHCTVYNFSVEEDETYVANNIVVHNCKGFSTAGVKEDGWGKEVKYSDNVWQQVDDLFDQFCRMLEGTMPKVFTAENVSGLTKGASKGYFLEIMQTFDKLGYHVRAPMLNSSWLGVPQSRERIIFMGVRKDIAKKLKLPNNSQAVPSVVPFATQAMLADALPHIAGYKSTKQDIIVYKPAVNGPMPTITAADAIAYETARFSSAGFIELLDGTRRKLTIDELLVISGMPSDYKLLGKFEEQWERLGRVCVPAMTHHASKALIEHILIPYCKARNKKPGQIFK